jgi:hypothetical protein
MADEEKLDQELDDQTTDEDLQDVDTGSDDTTPDEGSNDTVPLRTHLEIKKSLKEAKKRLADLEKRTYDQDMLDYKGQIIDKYTKAGYEENLASMLADDLASIRERQAAKRQYDEEDLLDDEIKDLASTDEYFADAVQYSDDIKNKVKEFKKKNVDLSVEDAFALVATTRRRSKELKINAVQREIIRNKNSGSGQPNVPTTGGSSVSQKFNLDSDDRKALKQLQQMQPNANWTPEKYHKIMKN